MIIIILVTRKEPKMTLQDLISNPQSLVSLYGHWPSLKGGRITFLKFHERGPTLDINILLNQVPDYPPKRWSREEYNAVSISISFFGAESISMKNWGVNNVIKDLLVEDNEVDGIPWKKVDCKTEEVQFQLQCIDIRVYRVVPVLISS